MMMKKCGVYVGLLGMAMAVMGIPPAKAQNRVETSGVAIASAATPASEPAAAPAPSPAELDKRIEALEQELAELRGELETRNKAEASAAAVATPAQPAAPQGTPAPAKTTIASLLGPTSLSGFVDTYYDVNFNHPASQTTGFRSFEYNSHQFALNMIELILDKAPDPSSAAGRTGYHVALGYGQAMTAIDATEYFSSNHNLISSSSPGFDDHVKEAYFSYLAPVGKGLQFDVGKFVTSMGAEVIESKDNWNYSRGMLFSYAIPFFHFGVRAKYAFNSKVSATGFLLNGWNNVLDNNSGKTYGFSLGLTPSGKVSFATTYLAGPEQPTGAFGSDTSGNLVSVNSDWRQTWDEVVSVNPTSKLSFLFNFDYGRGDRTVIDSEATPPTLSDPVYWTGLAGYVKYAVNANNYVAGRYEYYYDHDGFTTATPIHTHFNTITVTYQRTLASYLLTRLEFRRDTASQPVYALSNFSNPVSYQNDANIGLIFLFDSRNAK
jgi:Putative beta-barrel porin-2, OmpL-like. bbp2